MSVTDGSTVISPDRGVGRVGTGYVLLNVQTRLEPIDSAGLWRTIDACRGRHADGERDKCTPREKSNMRKQISSPFDCRAGSYRDQAERRRSEPTDSLPIFRWTECKWDAPSAGSLVRLASHRSERSRERRGATRKSTRLNSSN